MIENMKSKMTTKSQLSTTEPKKEKKKEEENNQNHRPGDHMESCQRGGGECGEKYRD